VLNPLAKAIDEVKRRIPREILNIVFQQPTSIMGQSMPGWNRPPTSIDESLLTQVIRPRVLIDCNIVGGTEVMVPLNGIASMSDPAFDYIKYYDIPKRLTQGRSIVSVINVTYADATKLAAYGGSGTVNNSAMMYTGQAMIDAYGTIPVVSTAYAQLVGENVVMVKDSTILPPNVSLRCIVADDPDMAHLQIRSLHPFCKLVELAVKAHIYNEYVVQLDIGQIYAGQNIGRIREIIDSYADANDLYETYLKEKWMKIARMNDRESWQRDIKFPMGGMR